MTHESAYVCARPVAVGLRWSGPLQLLCLFSLLASSACYDSRDSGQAETGTQETTGEFDASGVSDASGISDASESGGTTTSDNLCFGLDSCEVAGAANCSQGYRRECQPVGSCLVWGQAWPCPTLQCQADGVGCQSCVDQCDVAGASKCDAGQLQTCVVDVHGCLSYSAPTACETGLCADFASCGQCDQRCPLEGATECFAGEIRSCLPDDHGCRSWSTPVPCTSGKCSGPRTCDGCFDECGDGGETQCVDGLVRRCEINAQGCHAWTDPERCPDGFCTTASSCGMCENECPFAGDFACVADKIASCQADVDGCLTLGPAVACPAGKTCQNGRCTSLDCDDECSSAGTTACSSGNQVTCIADGDLDDCLEWGPPQACAAGWSCRDGRCKADCSDACSSGDTTCAGTAIATCAVGSSGCWEWGTPKSCAAGLSCVNNACVPVCQNACMLGAQRCAGALIETCVQGAQGCTVWGPPLACDDGGNCAGGDCPQNDEIIVDQSSDAPDLVPGDGTCNCGLTPGCSLRAAIQESNALAGVQTVVVRGRHETDLGALSISSDLVVRGENTAQIDATNQSGVLVVNGGAKVRITGVTLSGGRVQAGACGAGVLLQGLGTQLILDQVVVENNEIVGLGSGAGVRIEATASLTMTRSSIRDNRSDGSGVGLSIQSSGSILLDEVEISGNRHTNRSAHLGTGVHINNSSDVTLDRVLITNNGDQVNSIAADGGGILIEGSTTQLTLRNSTIANNISHWGSGFQIKSGFIAVENATIARNRGLDVNTRGIYFMGGSGSFINSIVSGNISSASTEKNCHDDGRAITLGGNISSLMETPSGMDCGFMSGLADDVIGDPKLAASLQDNGGFTRTLSIATDSPARDRGTTKCPARDQRGLARGSNCDAGAFEVQ